MSYANGTISCFHVALWYEFLISTEIKKGKDIKEDRKISQSAKLY